MGNKGKTKKMVRFEVLENKDATKEKNVQEVLNSKKAQKLIQILCLSNET